jgi:hypothetical protein
MAAIPFIIIRLTYSCMTSFRGTNFADPTWSPVFGSIAALVVMHSLMEYIVVVILLTLGMVLPPTGKKIIDSEEGDANGADELRLS